MSDSSSLKLVGSCGLLCSERIVRTSALVRGINTASSFWLSPYTNSVGVREYAVIDRVNGTYFILIDVPIS